MASCYEFERPVEVCVDGPVGNGDTAMLQVFLPPGGGFDAAFNPIGEVANWDGSTEVFEDWISGDSFSGCDVLSSKLTVTLVGDDEVEVIMEIVVENCPDTGGVYEDCGGPGPHTFTDTKIVMMTVVPCSE